MLHYLRRAFRNHFSPLTPYRDHISITTCAHFQRCTYASGRCRTRRTWSSKTLRLKIWQNCKKCSVVNGSLSSCKPRRSTSTFTIASNRCFCNKIDVSYRVDKKRDRLERQILDSQERAFWDVHRPVVSFNALFFNEGTRVLVASYQRETPRDNNTPFQPGCVNTTEVDFRKLSRSGRPKYSATGHAAVNAASSLGVETGNGDADDAGCSSSSQTPSPQPPTHHFAHRPGLRRCTLVQDTLKQEVGERC